jgi:hypothetical protein
VSKHLPHGLSTNIILLTESTPNTVNVEVEFEIEVYLLLTIGETALKECFNMVYIQRLKLVPLD